MNCGEEGTHSITLIRSQSFSGSVTLGCDLHKCFSAFFSPLSKNRKPSGGWLDISLTLGWLGSGK